MNALKVMRRLGKVFNGSTLKIAKAGIAAKPAIAETTEDASDISYTEQLSKHRPILQIYDLTPETEQAYISPSAVIAGEVTVGPY